MSKTANPHRCLEVLKADYEKEGIESFVEFYSYAIRVRVVYCTNFMIESWEYKTLASFLREAKEKHIVATYIEETAPQKINITAKVRQAILDRQSTGKITIFDKAADALSSRIEKEVYPQFRSEFHSTNVVKGKKDLIPAMLELPAKKPSLDVLSALVLFLTGEKAELQVHRLNNEPMLKKWLAQGTYLIEILWAVFTEDMDPDVLRSIFEVLTDSGLQQLLEKAATVGYQNDIMLSEFEEPETVLKEYVITIEPDWWSKVLKKNLESIYKNSFKDTEDINDDIIEKALACVKSVIASICNPKEQLPARIQNLLFMQYSIIAKLYPESTASQRAMSVSKFLLDAVCGIICAPSKANFDVKLTAGSISRTNFAMLVADCLRSLFEEGDDNLSRTTEVNNLVRQVRKHIPPTLVQNMESIIKTGQVTMPPRKIILSDLNLAAIGHYFASNASFLLKNYGPEKLVCLHMFLMDNVREGSFSRTQTDSLSEDSEGGKSMMSSMGVPMSGKLTEGRTSKSTATMSKISRNISTIEGSGKRRDFSNAMSSANLGGSGVVSRFSPDTPISEVLRFVCKEQLKLQLDSSSLAKTLQDDCIFTLGHLQLLPPQELYNIRIPALIRYVLASQYCNKDFAHFAGGGGGGRAMNVPSASAAMANTLGLGSLRDSDDSGGGTRAKSNAHKGLFEDSLSGSEGEASGGGGTSTVSSNILNLGNDERLLIRKSWMRLAELMKEKAKVETSSGPQLVSDVFYSTFWEEFLKNDESARKMFQQRSPKEREVHLNRILGHSISILDQPSLARQKIAQLGIQHCIWDIQKSSFDSMSLAFSSALFAALKGEADEDTNSAWFNFLVGVSSLISDRYERVKTGYRGEIFHRHGSEWRKKGFLLTHEALMLFKSPEALAQGKKPKFTLLFAHATDFDTEETDQRIDKVTPYCFSIIFGSVIKYFCVKSSEDFKEWADNITWRIKAFRRIKEANEKEGTKYLTRAEMKKGMVKDGKTKLSKPEKAAQKVLRYRKHMDAQIKSTADFQIFDGLLQATIVIDTKGTITYLNDAASKLFELAPADMLEKNVKNFMPQQFAQQHDTYINNYITTGKRKIIGEGRDVPVKAKSGDKIVNLTVVDHQQTGQRFFIGTLVPAANDVSSSGSNEANYKQDFSIFDKMLQPTIAITKEGLIDYVNDPMMQLTGYTKPELLGKNVTMLMTEKDANVHDSILRAYLRTGVKRIIGTPGRPVTIKEKTENTVRCLLTVTEHFQGSTPFFMGTIVKDKDLASSTESQHSEGQSDNQFALFDNLLDATICINQAGTIMYCNNATRELTGYGSAELVSKNITTLMTPMYARKHDGYLKNYQKTGIKNIIGRGREVPIVIRTGAEVKVFLTVTEHEISGVSCYIGTLTLKKDEFALYDNLLDATIVINEQGQIQYCNNAVKKLLGYNPQSLIGKNVKMLMPKEYADKHDKYLKNYMTTGKKKIIGTGRTLPFVTRNKTVVSGFLNVVESNISGKRIFVGTMTLKKAHDEAEEKQLLQATKLILCDLANPAIVISKRGMIKVFNSAAENVLGYKENDVLNKNIKMLMPEEFAVRHDDILKNYLKTGKSSIIGVGRFLPFVASDGETIKLYLTLSEKKDKEGKSIYFIGILTKMVETAL